MTASSAKLRYLAVIPDIFCELLRQEPLKKIQASRLHYLGKKFFANG